MTRVRRPKIPDAAWESHKAVIKRLYLDEKRTLESDNGVIVLMKSRHKFCASKAQYETRFRRWGWRKNLKREEWRTIDYFVEDRKRRGISSAVYFFNERVSDEKVQKEIARYRTNSPVDMNTCPNQLPKGVSFEDSFEEETPSSPDGTEGLVDTPSSIEANSLQLHSSRSTSPFSLAGFFSTIETSPSGLSLVPSRSSTPINFDTDLAIFFSGLEGSSPSLVSVSGFTEDATLPALVVETPASTLSLLNGLAIPLLEVRSTGSANAQLNRMFNRNVGQTLPLLPGEAQRDLRRKSSGVVFFNMIMFLLMNNFAGSDEVIFEHLFQQLHHFSIPQMEQILDTIPFPFSEALQQSILTIAIKAGVVAIVRILLQRGLDPNRVLCRFAGYSYTALGLACKFRHIEVVRLLMEFGVDVRRHDGNTAIFHLLGFQYDTMNNDEEIPPVACNIFRLLLEAGTRVSWYELETTMFWRNRAWLDVYLEYCTEPLMFTEAYQMRRPLLNATRLPENNRVTRAVKVLLGDDFKVTQALDSQVVRFCMEAFLSATFRDNEGLVDYFLKAGLQPPTSSLAEAVRGGCRNIAHRLIEAGLRPDHVIRQYNNQGRDILLPYAGILPSQVEDLLYERYQVRHDFTTPYAEAIRWRRTSFIELFKESGGLSTLTDSGRFVPALVAASEAGNIETITSLLDLANFTPNVIVPASSLAVSLATLGNHEIIVTKLMTAGIEPIDANITAALLVRNAPLVRLFLDTGAPVDIPGLVYFGVRWGDYDVVRDLITAGASINESGWHIPFLEIETTKRDTAETPLGQALRKGDHRIVELLLDNGAHVSKENPNAVKSYKGYSPLAIAVQLGSESLVRELLSRGAEANDPVALLEATSQSLGMMEILIEAFTRQHPFGKKYFASKALRRAIRSGKREQVRLLARYADLNDREQRKEENDEQEIRIGQYDEILPSPLGEGILGQDPDIIQTLLDCGGDPNSTVATTVRLPHRGRWTAILQAICTNDLATVRLLCDAGAQVNCDATLGITRTPLQLAVEIGNLDIIELLLERGAEVNASPCIWGGGTAFQLAAIKGYVGIAKRLLQHGANINGPRGRFQGRTAFEGAAEHGRMDMLLLLHHKGVDLISDGGEQVRMATELAERNGQLAAKSLVEQLARSYIPAMLIT